MTSIACVGCSKSFTSKNQLFRHLHQSAETCLSPDEYKDFLASTTQTSKREKIGVLYGYLPGTDYRFLDQHIIGNADSLLGIEGGKHAAWLVTQAIDAVSHGIIDGGSNFISENLRPWSAAEADDSKINRSYGSITRVSECVAQDPYTGAITEVLCTNAVPFYVDDEPYSENGNDTDDNNHNQEKQITKKTRAWVKSVNEQLDRMLAEMASARHSLSTAPDSIHEWSPGMIRVFGRVSIPQKKFNAEIDVTHRRMDYCLPADFLYAHPREGLSETSEQSSALSCQEFCDSLPSFFPDNALYSADSLHDEPSSNDIPSGNMKAYLHRMKQIMKRITKQQIDENATAHLGKECSRKSKKKKGTQNTSSNAANSNDDSHENTTQPSTSMQLPKRKRYHNFCPKILAHDYLAFRRVDRMYHRATIRVDTNSSSTDKEPIPTISSTRINGRPIIIFSLTGDMFLQEQVLRLMGLLIAICRGVIDDDIIECMFDEEYTNLVPAPPAPHIGLVSGEATYTTWEGRIKTILNARRTDRYPFVGRSLGWNDDEVVRAVEEWEKIVLHEVGRSWYWKGEGKDGRLIEEMQWSDNVLHPWARRTRELLDDYRVWKAFREIHAPVSTSFLPPLESIDQAVPPLFEKVLFYLRQADASGMWPSTTPNRQLVMLSTLHEESQARAISSIHLQAKKNVESQSSAYSFREGNGGASGSFSVGFMPDERCSQPKGNTLFPELVKAAFELELALCPDREPSSTIAINRNAQFRPHTDKGAGAGQSTSLIVGLGNYVGGELVVEGVKKDIRYKAIEFDGWKER
ncbi:hypothetical protein ACHAWU_000150 [Discostella pseudostelligera]|uniref:C2H2-type domain-containing protein n=1 Tax=Discostella pseudostelligera TaxID=259834 RepID=A0ABD3MUX5_9STRA